MNLDQTEFRKIVSRLKTEFQPLRAFLFGSRATGKAQPHSDYDFVLVVKESSHSQAENMIFGKKLTRDLPVSADVFVYTESEFNEWKNEFNSIPEVAINTGVELDLKNF